MHIAYICADPGVPVYGRKGASVHVQEVVRALRTRGASVELFATSCEGDPPPGLEDVPLHRLPPVGKGDSAGRERRALAANAGLHSALEHAGRFDLVYERYALWSFAGMSFARGRGIPAVLEVNAPLIEEHARHRGLVDRTGAERVARMVFELASAVLAVSAPVAAWVRERSPHPSRVHVVANGVDPRRFAAPALQPQANRPDHEHTAFTVGFVGTLKPWHGVDTLVRAFALMARDGHTGSEGGCRLLIVGDGPQRQDLEELVDVCGVAAATTFTGSVEPADIPAWLTFMDVATAPYGGVAEDYFSPLKVYEYLAAGLPVVASAVGQIAEVLRDGETAVLTAPGDVAALARALRILRDDAQGRRALASAGRRWVLQERTWDHVAARILELGAPGIPAPESEVA